MDTGCPKCGGSMDEGRIAPKFLFGYKSEEQKHFSFECNIQKDRTIEDTLNLLIKAER